MRKSILPIIAALLLTAALTGIAAAASHAACMGRSVTLAQASTPPVQMIYLQPGQGYAAPLKGLSDVGAYTWAGDALGCQRAYRDSYTWRTPEQGMRYAAVRYNRTTHRFLNSTDVPVVVAVWEG